MRRHLASLALAALAALALAGCTSAGGAHPSSSASASAAATCSPAKSGSVSDSVKVTGGLDAAPTVTFSSPLKVSTTQRTVVTQGEGKKSEPAGLMNVEFTLYDGTTDAVGGSTGHGASGQPVLVTVDSTHLPKGFVATLSCATVGSRIVGVIPAKDGLGSTGEQLGIAAKDTLVLVADVVSVVPSRADGAAQPAPAGFPKVKLAKDGKPTVTIPAKSDPPTATQVGVLKKGTGTVVAAGDSVTVQYQGVNWRTGKVFDQSWGKGGPTALTTTQVVAGFGKALVGQAVGSQVIVIIPPADGYGASGSPSVGIKGTDTLVFVIDILATQAPAAG